MDIGFGDAVEPGLEEAELPVLLDQPAPRLRAYTRETVMAEKFQAMVALGRANTRLKDFYDVWVLSRTFAFDTVRLARAIHATFRRRGTPLPAIRPDVFSADFAADPSRRQQWAAFVDDLAAEPLGWRPAHAQAGDLVHALRPPGQSRQKVAMSGKGVPPRARLAGHL